MQKNAKKYSCIFVTLTVTIYTTLKNTMRPKTQNDRFE